MDYKYSPNLVSFAHPPISAPSKSGNGSGSLGSGSSTGNGGYSPHAGAYKDRRRRADFNALRRSGDWDALEVPTLMLWLEDELLEDALMY